ncbi:prephenate dehydrogenase/arogenate dehydrogenase family protein [Thermoleophilia bacterium SCSIO 60948]|nr:prephenate dehydrogenase/arogenate dehydrogenase family protein [Thermoleophilia bacterium SCSIO 60948]
MTRVAILGVGLIGGSVALAARERYGASVAGWDRDPAAADRGVELGVLDVAAGSIAEAAAGADLVVCAAPVAELPALCMAALDASDADSVVTDVGSTKREVVAACADHEGRERFVGGHPLAGAETAGVENARAGLFEGAAWYLTPSGDSGGITYDRLQRFVTRIGARPQAIEAESHDRVMASVSHVPHVIANALVAEAAAALGRESERLPEVGRSFRDTTRVAGANPAIWADIFAANSGPVADGVDAVAERLREAAELIRSRDRDEIAAWHRAALDARRSLLEGQLERGELREIRIVVANRPGTVAEIALALGRAGVNIEDMGLAPAADMRTGSISIWVTGERDVERTQAVAGELGHAVSVVGAGG